MWEYNYTQDNNELCHYGVLGMKWGKRKFQERGGSYTKKGLKVFENKMNKYESANQKVKSLKKSGNKDEYRLAKGERRSAKNDLNKSYKQLKADYRADKGKRLYQNGKTITENAAAHGYAEAAVLIGSRIAQRMIARHVGNYKVANLASNAIAIGGTAVNAILAAKTYTQNKNLRAYYSHDRTIK